MPRSWTSASASTVTGRTAPTPTSSAGGSAGAGIREPRSMQDFRVVRLNANLFPPSAYEMSLYERYQISPILAEANTPADIIPWVANCDALFAISVALPAAVVDSLERC